MLHYRSPSCNVAFCTWFFFINYIFPDLLSIKKIFPDLSTFELRKILWTYWICYATIELIFWHVCCCNPTMWWMHFLWPVKPWNLMYCLWLLFEASAWLLSSESCWIYLEQAQFLGSSSSFNRSIFSYWSFIFFLFFF